MPPASEPRTATIVLADHDSVSRAVISGQLRHAGHTVVEAPDGVEAIASIDRVQPAVVLARVGLPGVDGFALLAQLHDLDSGETPPAVPPLLVMLSSGESDDDAVRAIGAGAVDVIRTPAPAHELLARVGLAVRLHQAEQALSGMESMVARAARTDALTGVANRTHTDEHLSMATSAARRHHRELAVLLVDIDHLKRINDDSGSAAGDATLREVATRVSRLLRGEDMVGRWGGEEFLIVAPGTDLDGAWRLGERIRLAVTDTPIAVGEGREVVVTVSVGCATGAGNDRDAHLRRVERALALAKSGGRNRVCTDAAV